MCAATTTATTAAGEWWRRGGQMIAGGFSHESEHDLALMVSDFLETGGGSSAGGDSWCSSDSDSGLSDLHHLAENISFHKRSVAQYENDLVSVVQSLMLSMTDSDLMMKSSGSCSNGSCIRFSLVKLLRQSGYDAAVCSSKWIGSGKVPGGDHQYIDVVNYTNSGCSERLIIDIDFRSHFEIARAVHSYNKILKSLPVVYVGSLTRLKQYLQVMADATKSSLKQNSMPLPPWRSLAYLQAKWQSPYQRNFGSDEENLNNFGTSDHEQCCEHLKRMQSSLQSEMEGERHLTSMNGDTNWMMKFERRRHSLFRGL